MLQTGEEEERREAACRERGRKEKVIKGRMRWRGVKWKQKTDG